MGIVIGRSGQTIKAIRKLLTVRAMADNVRVNLMLNEVASGAKESPEQEEVVDSSQAEPDQNDNDREEEKQA